MIKEQCDKHLYDQFYYTKYIIFISIANNKQIFYNMIVKVVQKIKWQLLPTKVDVPEIVMVQIIVKLDYDLNILSKNMLKVVCND